MRVALRRLKQRHQARECVEEAEVAVVCNIRDLEQSTLVNRVSILRSHASFSLQIDTMNGVEALELTSILVYRSQSRCSFNTLASRQYISKLT